MPPLSVHSLLLTTLGAAFASWAVFPGWRRLCLRWNWVDDPGHRKIHTTPTPLAGGWSVLSGLLFAIALTALFLPHGTVLSPRLPLVHLILPAIALFALGAWDDRVEISPAIKFAGQTLAAVLVVGVTGLRLPLPVPSPILLNALTVLWILSVTNAFNLSDNMNGLCSGLTVIAAGLVAWHNFIPQPGVALLAALIAGSFLGFLPWNYPRASAFLGDAGSHLAGFLVALLTLLSTSADGAANPSYRRLLPGLLVVAVPLVDVAQVFIHRTAHGRPFWIGDTNHLSHRLARTPLGRAGAVAVLWIAALVVGSLAAVL